MRTRNTLPGGRAAVIASTLLLLIPLAILATVLSLPDLVRGSFLAIPAHGELALLVLVIWWADGAGRRRRLVRRAAGVVLGYLIGFAVAEAGVRWVYARPFSPGIDIPMVRSLIQLGLGPVGPLADILTPIVIVAIFVAFFALGIAVEAMVTALWRRLPARRAAGASAVGVIVLAATVAGFVGGSVPVVHSFTAWGDRPGLHLREVTLDSGPAATGIPETAPTTTNAHDTPVYRFPGILDRDIYVFAIEAYGYATVTHREIAEALAPDRQSLEAAFRSRGYQVVSSYLRSPVAGGFSWLAEATFLTGQWIDSQAAFEELYDAEVPSLTGVLQAAGYRTFTVRPGTVHGAWPEGWDLYRFEDALIAYDGDFDYHGPWFSYVAVTDQYAIRAGDRWVKRAIAPGGVAADRPLLAYYQLVSSHTPFNRIPPYLADWSSLGNGAVYNELSDRILTFDNTWTGGTQLVEGYTAAISYVLRTLAGYVRGEMDVSRSPIVVIFGDHQAQRPIREPNAHLSVPIHIASPDPAVLQAFVDRGFRRGMVSDEAPPHRAMSDFFPLFIDVARGAPPTAAGGG